MQFSKTEVNTWKTGVWMRAAEPSNSIVKIKYVRGSWGERVAVLWLNAAESNRIAVIVYQVHAMDAEQFELRWHDGYRFGGVYDDEDDILDAQGKLDVNLMIASIDDSLENMEYGLTSRKELTQKWQEYMQEAHIQWAVSPIQEERM